MDSLEFARHISPVVGPSVGHNTQTLSNLRSLSSSLIGLVAGLFGLESYPGFAFFVVAALLIELVVLPVWVSVSTSRVIPLSHPSPSAAAAAGRRKVYFDDPAVASYVKGSPASSSGSSWRSGAIADWSGSIMQYILTWTLVYGIVGA